MSAKILPNSLRTERLLAAALLALPLVFLLTDHSREVWLWHYSKHHLAVTLGYALFYALSLWSYRLDLPVFLRKLRLAGLVFLTAALAAVLGAELFLRAVDDAPFREGSNAGRHAPDPDVGHVYYPDHAQLLTNREFQTAWRSNAQGVRAERDFGRKPAGVYRILVVGDSFTAGDQVSYPETYPAVLESLFAEALGPGRVEVVNAGFPGYGTVNEARWLAKFGPAFEPDLVVLGLTANDLLENQYPLQYVARDGAMVSEKSTDADRARWAHHRNWYSLRGAWQRSAVNRVLQPETALRRLLGKHHYTHRRAFMVEQDAKSRELYELARRYLVQALEVTRSGPLAGAGFALLVIPFREQLGALGAGLDPTALPRRMSALGAELGVPVLDALPDFRAHPDPGSLHWREDSHCTAAGYRLIAECLFRGLLAHADTLGLPKVPESP